MSFELFLIYSAGGHIDRRSKFIKAILVEGIMRNISVIGLVVQEEMSYSLSTALAAISGGAKSFR